MPTKATLHAVEMSTYLIQASFTDEVSSPVIPTSAWWSLEDIYGNAVNSRTAMPFSGGLAAQMDVVLTGADLALIDQRREFEVRRLVVRGLYNSSIGMALNISDSFEFLVYNTNILR